MTEFIDDVRKAAEKVGQQKIEAGIERADKVLRAYEGDADTKIIDILSDLRHYCEREHINFVEASRLSRNQYDAERYNAGHNHPKEANKIV
jgi:hypothetical protein